MMMLSEFFSISLTPLQQGFVWFSAWILGGLVLCGLIRIFWLRILMPLSQRANSHLHGKIYETSRFPLQLLVLASATAMGANATLSNIPEVTGHPLWSFFNGALYILIVLTVTGGCYFIALQALEWYGHRSPAKGPVDLPRRHMVGLLKQFTKILLLFIALTIILGHFNVQITGLIATAGIASLAVALAAQETLGNLIAGLSLMFDRPFKAGDRIQLPDGQIGDVMEVGFRSTKLLSFDQTVIAVPNSEMAKGRVINLNAPDARIKLRMTLGVGYSSDLRKVKAILLDVMRSSPRVLAEPEPAVYFVEFGDSALQMLMVCSVTDYRDRLVAQDELNMAIKDRFDAEGIEIPFPQRDIHIRYSDLPPKSE